MSMNNIFPKCILSGDSWTLGAPRKEYISFQIEPGNPHGCYTFLSKLLNYKPRDESCPQTFLNRQDDRLRIPKGQLEI